jgi:hypothetical protein
VDFDCFFFTGDGDKCSLCGGPVSGHGGAAAAIQYLSLGEIWKIYGPQAWGEAAIHYIRYGVGK